MNDTTTIPRSRRERLKQATLDFHRRVERVVEARGYFADQSSYGDWLVASLAFHRSAFANVCKRTVDRCLGPGAIAERLRLLELDITKLDLPVPSAGAQTTFGRQDAAETFGVLYVTEGAAMGARVLYVRARHLGFDADVGANFLGRQAHDLQSWRSFVTALDAFVGTEDQDDRLVRASCNTFELAARHYGDPP